DVAVGVQHALVGEDAAAGDEVFDQRRAGGGAPRTGFSGFHRKRISLSRAEERYRIAMAAMAVAASAIEAPRTPRKSESGPATKAPTDIIAGESMVRREMRARICSC